ncbi:hypothetical protein NVR00_06005 [Staphylococcus pseudintermedius]|uniref:hypothetical protein n=2 Tax=Staphylococcus pseudintermedius TaxID=283734 RepID=UPI0022E9C7FE|nr:hypothetical protein [Staphylococcus pseudintermedius]MDA3107503.1 hypothetical protein [Staphylococcus pseudintermedius]
MGKQKTLSDLDNLFKLSKHYDMDIIGLLIEKEKSNPKEMDNLINSKKGEGDVILNKNFFSIMFNVFIVIASIIFFFVFMYKGFDIYLCLMPLAVLFCGSVSLYVDLKKRKNTFKK